MDKELLKAIDNLHAYLYCVRNWKEKEFFIETIELLKERFKQGSSYLSAWTDVEKEVNDFFNICITLHIGDILLTDDEKEVIKNNTDPFVYFKFEDLFKYMSEIGRLYIEKYPRLPKNIIANKMVEAFSTNVLAFAKLSTLTVDDTLYDQYEGIYYMVVVNLENAIYQLSKDPKNYNYIDNIIYKYIIITNYKVQTVLNETVRYIQNAYFHILDNMCDFTELENAKSFLDDVEKQKSLRIEIENEQKKTRLLL